MIGVERRFVFKNVDAGTGDFTAVQCISQILGYDDRTAGFVDEEGRRFHVRQGFFIDQALRFVRNRAMEADDIGLFHHFFHGQVFNQFRIGFMGEAVIGDDLGAKGMDQFGDAMADMTGTDEGDGLAFQFVADEAGFRTASTAGCIDLRYAAEQIEHHGDGQFSYGNCRIAGRIADFDAFGFGRIESDVVDTGKGDVDVLQVRAGIDDFGFEGHIGDDEDIGVLGFFNLDGRVIIAFIRSEFIAFFFQVFHIRIK